MTNNATKIKRGWGLLDIYQKVVATQMTVIVLLLSTGVGVMFGLKTDVASLLAYRAADKEQLDRATKLSQDNEKRIYHLEDYHIPKPQEPEYDVRPKHIIKPDQRIFRKNKGEQ